MAKTPWQWAHRRRTQRQPRREGGPGLVVTPQGELKCTACGHLSKVELNTWYSIQDACPHRPQRLTVEQEQESER